MGHWRSGNHIMMRMLLTALSMLAAVAAMADEGMWTFDNFPRQTVKERYGAATGQPWLDHLRRATVRIEGGCTGSFVSPTGLVLTNHHCVRDCVQRLSTPERDLQAAGFIARSRAAEERCAAEQVSTLRQMEDVTAKVAAVVGEKTGPESNQLRKATLTRLEQECEEVYRAKNDSHSCQAVTLYGGGQYFLYHYKRYEDARLVFAPEADVAYFGGDVDNFQFPRWDLDMALLRVYENDKPAATPDFLRWRRAGARDGDAVFVAGHPGTTQRLYTVAQLRFERDVVIARWLPRVAELRGRYLEFGARGPEPARVVQDELFGLENALKVRRNQFAVLLGEEFLADKARAERELQTAVAANPKLRGAATAWSEIEEALRNWRGFYDRYLFLERGAGFQGELMTYARTLVRAAFEREKPNEQRLREFTEAALPRVSQPLLAPQPIDPELETLRLTFSLEKLFEYLGPDDATVRAVLGRDTPRALATRLVQGTRLADPQYRRQLWDGGRAAVEAAHDPMIALALRLEPEAREVRQRYDDEVEAVILRAGEQIARARFEVTGTGAYPDATFSLRLSYGSVQGWEEAGRAVTPFTTLETLYARATGQPPFRLPPRWLQAQDRLNLDTRINFTTNNDIVGGNSGSPVVDAGGRLVGLIFDGNIHSIGGTYWFDPALNRTVAVHPAGMLLALSEVYGAPPFLRELTVE
jgi:hypothetical protein